MVSPNEGPLCLLWRNGPSPKALARAKTKKRCGKARRDAAPQEGIMEQTPELTGIMESYSPKNQILPSRNWQWPGLTEGPSMTQKLTSYRDWRWPDRAKAQLGHRSRLGEPGRLNSAGRRWYPVKCPCRLIKRRLLRKPLRFPQPEIHTLVKEIWGWERPPTSGGTRDNPEGHTYGDWRRTNSQTRECLSEAEWLLPSL